MTAFNTSDSPVVVDGPGHLLGGREFGTVSPNTRETKTLLDRGLLQVIDDPGDLSQIREDAAEAIRATREANGQPADPQPKAVAGGKSAGSKAAANDKN